MSNIGSLIKNVRKETNNLLVPLLKFLSFLLQDDSTEHPTRSPRLESQYFLCLSTVGILRGILGHFRVIHDSRIFHLLSGYKRKHPGHCSQSSNAIYSLCSTS